MRPYLDEFLEVFRVHRRGRTSKLWRRVFHSTSKYMPHQGKREMARRRGDLAAARYQAKLKQERT